MYISEIKSISNYRNLSGLSFKFNSEINYIIGENNIGKTNILELLNIIFSIGKFSESDFEDILKPIKITLTIKYEDEAIGFFEDNFDDGDKNAITIIAEQKNIDSRINYYHDTPKRPQISSTIIKRLNVLYYYAQRMPIKELDFRKTSGSGKVLNYLVQKSLEKLDLEDDAILNQGQINKIISELNNMIHSLSNITNDKISAYLDPNTEKVVSRILLLGDDNNHNIGSLGVGIQYAFNILLQILEIIYNVKRSRTNEDFQERLIVKNGKKYFPIFLLLDEPEIHRHPYRQRNIIKKINQMMNNDNKQFTYLLHSLFQIDALLGQIIVVTHSPNILLSDYHQFIRFYRDKDTKELRCISGMNMSLENKVHKHLLHNFLYLKEAMFSRYVIFVEGDTERGAIPVIAERRGFDLDEHSVAIIKLDGADGIKHCMELVNSFDIPSIAIIDKDKKSKYENIPNVYFTNEIDYETDIYTHYELIDYLKCCKELEMIKQFINILKHEGLQFDPVSFINDPVNTVNINSVKQKEIMDNIKDEQLANLKSSKNALKGATLARYVTTIPDVFTTVLDKVKEELT